MAVRVHHPDLTDQEKEKRMKELKRETEKFFRNAAVREAKEEIEK